MNLKIHVFCYLATLPFEETPKENPPQNIDNVCEDDGHCIILGLAKLLQWSVPQYYQRVEGKCKFLKVEEIGTVVNQKSQLEIKRLNLETLEMLLRSFNTPTDSPSTCAWIGARYCSMFACAMATSSIILLSTLTARRRLMRRTRGALYSPTIPR